MKTVTRILFITLGALLCFVKCSETQNSTRRKSTESFVSNLIWECSKTQDVGLCLKSEAVTLLNKLVQMREPVFINEYLSLTRNSEPVEAEEDKNNSITDGEKMSAETNDEKNEELNNIIWKKLRTFFKTRTIHLEIFPNSFEGRSKEGKILKKGHGIFLMAAMMGGMMMKMALGKIALIAGKALLIGKIALILSLIISLKKFSEHGGDSGGHAEVIYASAEHGGRSLKFGSPWKESGSDLAYQAHRSKELEIL